MGVDRASGQAGAEGARNRGVHSACFDCTPCTQSGVSEVRVLRASLRCGVAWRIPCVRMACGVGSRPGPSTIQLIRGHLGSSRYPFYYLLYIPTLSQ